MALESLHDLERSFLPTNETKKTAEWWTVCGYRSILQDALARIERHERWAKKVYGERALSFTAALAACPRCRGRGSISVKHGSTFETDSAEERALAWHQEKCPACGDVIAEALQLAEERAARRCAEIVRGFLGSDLIAREIRAELHLEGGAGSEPTEE